MPSATSRILWRVEKLQVLVLLSPSALYDIVDSLVLVPRYFVMRILLIILMLRSACHLNLYLGKRAGASPQAGEMAASLQGLGRRLVTGQRDHRDGYR